MDFEGFPVIQNAPDESSGLMGLGFYLDACIAHSATSSNDADSSMQPAQNFVGENNISDSTFMQWVRSHVAVTPSISAASYPPSPHTSFGCSPKLPSFLHSSDLGIPLLS
jgi:hypothetical protein